MWKLLLLVSVSIASSIPTCSDGSIYSSDFNSCYKFIQEPNSYLNAEQICVNEGGHLASIRSDAENAFIEELVQSSSHQNDLYYWIGGPESDYSKWASGQHDQHGCTALTPCGGLWAKVDCTFSAPYVCRMEPFPCPDCPTCPVPHSYCDSQWTYLKETDSCYKGFFKAKWDEAEERCKSHGSHLASIHSDAENDFIFDLVTMGVDGKFNEHVLTWFGLHRSSPGSEEFEFTDGTKFDPKVFNKWAPNEPNKVGNNENCVEMYSEQVISEKDGKKIDKTKLWNDSPCAVQHRRFVCKKPAHHG